MPILSVLFVVATLLACKPKAPQGATVKEGVGELPETCSAGLNQPDRATLVGMLSLGGEAESETEGYALDRPNDDYLSKFRAVVQGIIDHPQSPTLRADLKTAQTLLDKYRAYVMRLEADGQGRPGISQAARIDEALVYLQKMQTDAQTCNRSLATDGVKGQLEVTPVSSQFSCTVMCNCRDPQPNRWQDKSDSYELIGVAATRAEAVTIARGKGCWNRRDDGSRVNCNDPRDEAASPVQCVQIGPNGEGVRP